MTHRSASADSTHWIDAAVFGRVAGIGERAAELALKKCESGGAWRGVRFQVRRITGVKGGGARGVKYEVLLGSLPPALQIKYQNDPLTPDSGDQLPSREIGATDAGEAQRRHQWLLGPLDAQARRESISRALVATARLPGAPSIRTLRNWFNAYLRDGLGGLCRKQRTSSGDRVVSVSKRWDAAARAAGLTDDQRRETAALIERHVRSLYAAGAPGAHRVAQLALPKVIEITRAAAVAMSDEEALAICSLPYQFIRRFRQFRDVAIRRDDAKQFSDRLTPRIRRDRSYVLPMEDLAGDVHPADVLYLREDGTTATMKMIAWLDLGTNRVRADFIALDKKKGIRQEDLIVSFIRTVKEWGVPSGLYLDNGSEYQCWTGLIKDALECTAYLNHKIRIDVTDQSRGGITRAKPYNAESKVIETAFSVLERGLFATIPGYIGGDRMAKKTQNKGREPKPFPGSVDELRRQFLSRIELHNLTPSRAPHLQGKSPNELFNQRVLEGWKKIDVDPHALEAVFAITKKVKINGSGRFTLGGVSYYDDRLLDFPGEKILVRVPKSGDRTRLAMLDRQENFLCLAAQEAPYAWGDLKGAKEQARRAAISNKRVSSQAAATDKIDLNAEVGKVIELHPPALEAPVGGRLMLSGTAHAVASAKRALPAPSADYEPGLVRQRHHVALSEQVMRSIKVEREDG